MEYQKKEVQTSQEMEEHFRFFANMIPDIIWTALPDGYEDFHNAKFTEYTGLSYEEAKGYGWQKSVHPDDLITIHKVWKECLENGKPYEMEYRIKNKEGEYKWFLIRALPWKDNQGKIIKWFGSDTDIHYGKSMRVNLLKATEELTNSNKELSRINDLLNHFVYIAAHDLRSPVSNIKMLIDLLNEEQDPKKAKELINFLSTSILRLEKTINGLIDVIKAENDQTNIKTLYFDQILNIVLADLSVAYPDIANHINADFTNCPSVEYIQPYLISIIKNLLSNAYKYKSPNRDLRVNISTEKAHEYIKIIISDNGKGFNMNASKDLFGAFKRFHNDVEGKGVGLFVVKSIIEKSGGKIEAQGKEDEGATFTIYLKRTET